MKTIVDIMTDHLKKGNLKLAAELYEDRAYDHQAEFHILFKNFGVYKKVLTLVFNSGEHAINI